MRTNVNAVRWPNTPEQELPIQVADVYRVHVNDVNVLEARQGEVGENLASETPCTDDEDFGLIPQEVLDLCAP